MEPNQETIFLRSRFGFVKMAMTTGADLVPVFAFGQSSIFGYARPGPPLFPRGTARLLSRALGFAPMLFWGRWGLPVPYAVPVHVVVGAPIRVQQGAASFCTRVRARTRRPVLTSRPSPHARSRGAEQRRGCCAAGALHRGDGGALRAP